MKHTKFVLTLLFIAVLGLLTTKAKQGVVSAGGEATGSGGTMSLSTGQPDFSQVYSSENNASNSNRQIQEISQKTKVDLISFRSDKNVEQDAAKKLHFFDQHIDVLRFAEIELNEYLKSKSKLQVGDIVNLNLFEDVGYTAVINRLTENVNGTITFVAGVNNPEAYVIVTTTGERSLASIFIPSKNRYYKIISDSQTLAHYLVEMEASARDILASSPPLIPDKVEQETEEQKRIRKQLEKEGLGPDDPANIDVMVVLTPAAKAWANESGGGMHNVIAHAMANAQLTHDNSLTLVDFTLVHSGLVSYIESGNSTIDLRRLTASPSFNPWGNYYNGYYIPGFMNDVHVWRDQYGADLVALFALIDDFGGYAWVLSDKNGRPNYGFSITRVQQAVGYTHVHEMGHNMGCHHHKDQNFSPGPTYWPNWPENKWSAGWRWTGDDGNHYCSVMTYPHGSYFPDGITHTWVPYFSNPLVTHQGIATGNPVDGDNARTISAVKHLIAAYRPQVTNFYDLTLEVKPPGTGIAEGAGAYMSGDQVLLSAMATEGYKFVNWTDSYGLVISREANFSYTMPANHITLNANFEIEGSLDNIIVSQRLDGSGLFDINYDLIGKDDEYFIFLHVSFDGNDIFHSLPNAHLVGDLHSVSPGSNKHIIWDGAASFPDTFSNNAKIKIEAVAYSGTGIPGAGVTDIDGNFYNSVIIGDQEWMSENLRVSHDADGNPVVRYCYADNTTNCDLHGGLYTWDTVMNDYESSNSNPSAVQGICPAGWHVPSNEEWTQLSGFLISNYDEINFNNVGNKLKSCRQVNSPLGGDCDTDEHPRWHEDLYSGQNNYGTDDFGFSALPGGMRLANGMCGSLYTAAYWWTTNEMSSDTAIRRFIGTNFGFISTSANEKSQGYSLRCVRDVNGSKAGKELILNYSDYFVFDTRFYELELITDPINSGTVSGAGIYMENKMIPVEAIAATGYSFINWTDANGVEVSPEDNLEYIMPPNDVSITANFTLKSYEINATVTPEEGGTVSGTGTYEHFQEVTLQAMPATWYIFEHWTEDDIIIMDGNQPVGEVYSFTAEENRNLVAHFEEMDQFTIQVMANPEEGGTVHGDGIFYEGSEVSVEAIPNLGYTFINWLENEQLVSPEAIYTFFVVSDRVLVAEFDQFFEITAEVHPEGTGEVEGTGVFAVNTNQLLEAIPYEGYHFNYWTENGTFAGDEAVLEIIINGDRHFIAHFSPNIYSVNAEPNDPAFGIVEGSGDYEHFEEVTLTAIPESGYHFVDWTENGDLVIDGDAPALATYTFMVDGPRDLVANFAINTYILTYYAGENGSLSGETQQLVEYGADGTPVEAIPDEGYHFTRWSDGLEDNPRTDTEVTADLEVTAEFTINTYEITAEPNNEDFGLVTGAGDYEHGQTVTLEADPGEGYHFVEWTEDGDHVSDDTTYVFTAEEDRNLVAVFAINVYTIAALPNDEDFGAVTGEGDYEHFEEVTLTATPNTGYHFVEWQEDDEVVMDGDEPAGATYAFTAIANRDLVAYFAINTYVITATAGEGGSIDPKGDIVVEHGSSQLFTITPDEGYEILDVLVDGDAVGAVDQHEFTNVTDDHSIEAIFEIKTYVILATADEGGNIDPEGDIVVEHGSSQLFTITPDEGYEILDVLVDGNSVGAVDHYEFVYVMDNHTITAEFEIEDETGTRNIVDKVSVYPNPFDHTVTISNAAGLTSLVIKNIFGQTIFEKTLDGSDELIIIVESFTPGVYIFRLIGSDNSVRVLKMIKE